MVPRLIGRGVFAGAIAGLLAFVFGRIFAEPQIQKAINYESARDAAQQLLDKAAGLPVAAAGPDIFSRSVQANIGIGVGMIAFGAGEMENRNVEITIEQKAHAMMIPGMGPGNDGMEFDFQGMLEKVLPKNVSRRQMTVAEARNVLFEQETESLINAEKVNAQAIELAENVGIIFVDEMDKVVATEGGRGADVSRQGVQRDLLPIVEGTTVNTRYGYVRTDHVLFVAAGAFHKTKPSDLMPELQGRFPIRVELKDLTKDDFVRILTEPKSSLTKQYTALLKTEGVDVDFTPDAVDALASYAFDVNQRTQNIGARRLYTILERLLEELSLRSPRHENGPRRNQRRVRKGAARRSFEG